MKSSSVIEVVAVEVVDHVLQAGIAYEEVEAPALEDAATGDRTSW